MIELNRIYNEDCLEGMKRIPDKSVDMIDIECDRIRTIIREIKRGGGIIDG